MSWEETARKALLVERDTLRAENDRLREALREIVSKARTTGYGKPALATIAVAALAKEAGK